MNEPPVGIRWGPTIAGAVLLVIGIVRTVSAMTGGLAPIGMTFGVLLLVIGIILLRIGRRDLTRPLRTPKPDR